MTADLDLQTIMIVDDEPDNLNVLGDMLVREGFGVRAFPSGEEALASAREDPPALVLLDIRMPVLDGYQVCRRFKADRGLCSLPIIFLSAFSGADDKVLAFEAGGVDYVTKPFSEVEVLARVRTHLRLQEHQSNLEGLVLQRVSELAEAHRRLQILDDTKTSWLHLISHEMRTPLTGLFGISEMLLMQCPPDPEASQLRASFDESCSRINKLIDDATTIAEIDVAAVRVNTKPVLLWPVLKSALKMADGYVSRSACETALAAVATVAVSGEEDLLGRALEALVLTVVSCVSEGETISLGVGVSSGMLVLSLEASGSVLTPETTASFFEVGGQRLLYKTGGDFGMGAALADRILKLFGGGASVRNGSERGFVLEIALTAVA